jgi:hypothetical protein
MPALNTVILPAAATAVRGEYCNLCHVVPGEECTARGDHLARWVGAHSAGRISRAQLTAAVARLVVLTRWTVIGPDGAE